MFHVAIVLKGCYCLFICSFRRKGAAVGFQKLLLTVIKFDSDWRDLIFCFFFWNVENLVISGVVEVTCFAMIFVLSIISLEYSTEHDHVSSIWIFNQLPVELWCPVLIRF